MLRYLRGFAEIRVTGASPEDCLNRMMRADIPFWKLQREGELALRCRVYLSQLHLAEEAARRAQCSAELLFRRGLPVCLSGFRTRKLLLIGVSLAVLTALYLQNFVWFLRVEGSGEVAQSRLLEALAEEGVCFGAWGPGIRSQALKHRLLNRIPELSWLAVNRSGGVLTVLYACRDPEPPEDTAAAVSNIVAARPGIVTRIEIFHGFAAVEAGDAVTEGQVLVSGLAEWTTHTQATRSIAEVYAETLRRIALRTPVSCREKVYTGREETCVYLIWENKRRKISGNSSIFGACCDKMRNREVFALPGGYAFPLVVETVTLREYRLEEVQLSETEAAEILISSADRSVAQSIVGRIVSGSETLQKNNGSWELDAERYCEELISVTVPVRLLGEDGYSGENHQRREN